MTSTEVTKGAPNIFRKLPDIEAALVLIPKIHRGGAVIPGISWGAAVEVLVFKDEFSLTSNLSELGDSFAVDSLTALGDSTLSQAVFFVVRTNTGWDLDSCYIAAPLEMMGDMYKMRSYTGKSSLFRCASCTIYDSRIGTFNPLEVCLFQVDHLMGQCQIGMVTCREGLIKYVSTNKEIASQQP